MSIIAYAQQVCSILDELALPRAVVNTQIDRFVAWNPRFLSVLNVREEEIKTVAASEVLYFENGGVEFGDGLRMIPCSARPLGEYTPSVHGHAVLLAGGFSFVMLDVDKSVRQVFRSNLEAAVGQERNRLYRFLHDRLSPRLVAMAFLTETLAGRLETSQPEAVEEVAKIRRLLGDLLNEMHLLFAPPYSSQNSKGAGEKAPGPVGAEP